MAVNFVRWLYDAITMAIMDMDRNKIKNIKQKIKGGCVSDDAGKTIMMDDETGTGRDGGDAVVRGSKFWSRAFTVDGWMDE